MATRTWDNGASTQNWEDANNWSGNTVPVTGDDAVIPTGMGTIAGTPSADELGTVTVNGNSVLNVALVAANFVFNGTSINIGTLSGEVSFNDSAENAGSIAGNCTFDDFSFNSGSITGNASFNNTVQSTATTGRFNPQQWTVSGTVDFPSGCEFTLVGTETWTVDTTGWTASSGVLKWVFNGDSSANYNILNGDADFLATGSSNYTGTVLGNAYFGPAVVPSVQLDYFLGIISGNCELAFDATVLGNNVTNPFFNIDGTVTISGNLVVEYSGNDEYFDGNTSAFVVTGSLGFVFSGTGSYNYGTVVGGVTLSGSGSSNSGTITGNVVASGLNSFIGGTVTGICNMVSPTAYCYNAVVIGTVIVRNIGGVQNMLLKQHTAFDTATYTPTLLFPFADVLGTGLL